MQQHLLSWPVLVVVLKPFAHSVKCVLPSDSGGESHLQRAPSVSHSACHIKVMAGYKQEKLEGVVVALTSVVLPRPQQQPLNILIQILKRR